MSRAEIVFPSLILAFTATFLAIGNFHYEYSWTAFAFPFGTGIVLCALCAAGIVSAAAGRRVDDRAETAKTVEPAAALSLSSLGWMFALAVFLYAFGFVLGSALYLLVCLRANGFSWTLALSIAVASVAVTWGLFIRIMGIQLPLWPLWWP